MKQTEGGGRVNKIIAMLLALFSTGCAKQEIWRTSSTETLADGSHVFTATAKIPPVTIVRKKYSGPVAKDQWVFSDLICYEHEVPVHIENPTAEDFLEHDHLHLLTVTPAGEEPQP